MSRIFRVAVLSLALSCTSDNDLSLPAPPPGFPTAYATSACGPGDGPAMQLYLATEPAEALPPPAPFVEVTIWQGVHSLSGRRFEWTGVSSEGTVRRCDAGGACVEARSVALQFRPIETDTTVTGVATLQFTDGSTVAGGFNAAWRTTRQMCG